VKLLLVDARDSPHAVYERILASGEDVVVLTGETADLLDDQPPAWASNLASALTAPLACTSSPTRLPDVSTVVSLVDTGAAVPVTAQGPPSSLPMAVSVAAVRSISRPALADTTDARPAVLILTQMLQQYGWRHVVVPNVVAPVSPSCSAAIGIDTLWAELQLRAPTLLVDGSCLTGDVHNGSQLLVLNIVRSLAAVRPEARVELAVQKPFVPTIQGMVGASVRVIPRRVGRSRADLLYRPYQVIDPRELRWILNSGRRLVVGQLDMIGFSNRAYHPSRALFDTVQSIQRSVAEEADAIACLSDFGKKTLLAEVPTLDESRIFVVSCGTDSEASPPEPPRDPPTTPFLACISATFWHKNRPLAIATFAELCERYGWAGSLVIAGPEPTFGDSSRVERAMLGGLPDSVARRVRYMGRISANEKAWLLQHAEAVLYPSVVEGFGLIPFEAAAAGTPCLSPNATALGELFGTDAPTAVVDSWDPSVWADRVWHILSDSQTGAQTVAAVRRVGARHEWNDVAARTWKAFDAAIAAQAKAPTARKGPLVYSAADATLAIHTRFFLARLAAHFRHRVSTVLGRGRAND
jgi:glycosyltransferase involved in cell wall biosynthesis